MNNAKEFLTKYIEEYIWSVIPVGGDKRPIAPWKENQIKPFSVSDFEALVETMRTITPHSKRKVTSGIALVTGEISGVTVVDLDDNYEKELAGLIENIDTPKVRTGGGGMHFYFKYCPEISQTQDPDIHIDIRNDGGYAVLPPSRSYKGEYSWIKSPDDVDFAELPTEFVRRYGATAKAKAPLKFEPVSEGARNNTAARVIGKYIHDCKDNLETAWNLACGWNNTNNPPLPEEELRTTFESILKIDGKNNFIEPCDDFSTQAMANREWILNKDRLKGIPTGFTKFDERVGGLIPGDLTLVAAQSGVGKSVLVMNILNNILERGERAVAYFDLENGLAQTAERMIRIRYGLSKDEFFSLGDSDYAEKVRGFTNFKFKCLNGNQKRDIETIHNLMKAEFERGASIFVIDPLQDIEGGDDMLRQREIIDTLHGFAQEKKVVMIVLHHVRKGSASGGRYVAGKDMEGETRYLDPEFADIKGLSKITDTAESVWGVMRPFSERGDTPRQELLKRAPTILKILKSRGDGSAPGAYKLFLDLVTLQFKTSEFSLRAAENNLYNSNWSVV